MYKYLTTNLPQDKCPRTTNRTKQPENIIVSVAATKLLHNNLSIIHICCNLHTTNHTLTWIQSEQEILKQNNKPEAKHSLRC